jgi:predicted DNA-binding transcriptional regulator YafY
MPTNKNAIIRYQALDKCFRDHRHRYYIEDLIDASNGSLCYYNGVGGGSRRQIFEDIKFMESEAGWSIPLERIKDGKRVYYRYEEKDFSINKQPLTDAEAQQLHTLIQSLSRFRGIPSNEWIEDVISNLEWRFNLKGKSENVIGFEQNQNLKGLEFLSDIIDATSNHQTLSIKYRNYKNGGRDMHFVIYPYYVKQYNDRWFLFGLDDKRREISNLALDRIQSIEILSEKPFIPNDTIDFEHYFDDIVGVTIPKENVEKENVVLRFSESRFPYVTSKPIHKSQKILSEMENKIGLQLRINPELETKILSFGSDVEVLLPEWFREKIKNKIEESLKKYISMQKGCTDDL